MAAADRPIRVLGLQCGLCGNPLRGAPSDEAFCCWTCGRALDLSSGTPVSVPLLFCECEGNEVLLPFWRFDTRVALASAPPEKELAVTRWCGPRQAWVPAFRLHNAQYFPDAGVCLTLSQPDLPPAQSGRIAGISRGRAAAEKHLEPILTTCLDRNLDVTGVRLRVSVEEATLAGVPFTLEGRFLTRAAGKLRYPVNGLEGAAELAELCGWPAAASDDGQD
jgi:hypothetical protein